jgi:hypothetical protein
MVWVNLKTRTPLLRDGAQGEFELGPDGEVARLGVRIEPALKEMMWFDRIL